MLVIHLLAQVAAAAAPEAIAAPTQGVISYPPAFFAAQQPANAGEMVARIPGFSLDTGSSVRGYEGAAGNVLIDGQRPSTKTDNLEEILRRIPATQVERIDVIRGGAPGIDMQGKTVLANVIRKKGSGFRALVAAAANHAYDGRTMGASRLEASGGSGDRKWDFGSFYGRGIDDGSGDGPGARLFADGRAPDRFRVDSEGDGENGFATLSGESPLAGGKLRLNGRVAWDKFKYEENVYFPGPGGPQEAIAEADHTADTEVGGNYSRRLGARTEVEVVALRQTHDVRVDSTFATTAETDLFQLDRQSSETIGRGVLKYRVNDRISLEGGAETALNKLDSRTGFRINGAPITLPAANVQVEEVRSEVFAKGAWRPGPKWTVDAGLRYESSTISSDGDVDLEKTLHFLKPRLAVSWAPMPSTQVRLRVEREVGQLNFDDFVAGASFQGAGVTAGNPDLNPQQAWVAEAAFEQRFWGSGVMVLTYTHRKLTDAIDRGPVFAPNGDVFDRPTNIGDGRRDDLMLELTVPFDRFGWSGAQFKGDVTKHWSEVTDPTTGETREISGLHPLDWNASFIQDLPRWKLSYGVDAYGGWKRTYYRFNQIEVTKLRTFVKPFVEWRPAPDLNIRIELPNVTARDLRRTTYFYPGPRSAGGAPDVDDRLYQNGRFFYFRVRKTFGA